MELTKTECLISLLVCYGYSNKKIADFLSISINTVKANLVNIYTKLNIHNRIQLVKEVLK